MRRAFTLVEVCVVVAILIILVALLAPAARITMQQQQDNQGVVTERPDTSKGILIVTDANCMCPHCGKTVVIWLTIPEIRGELQGENY
jgi:Tfp pilus assembly protein FimT